jgi:hypothetical protein
VSISFWFFCSLVITKLQILLMLTFPIHTLQELPEFYWGSCLWKYAQWAACNHHWQRNKPQNGYFSSIYDQISQLYPAVFIQFGYSSW